MSKLIEIVVSPTGQTHIQTKGFVGGECRQASRFIEQALGKQTCEELTAEFHQQVSQQQANQQQASQQQSHQQRP
jgi:hypothetical protein